MLKVFLSKDFLLSKRVVGVVVGVVVAILARKHIIVPDSVQEDVINGVIEVGGAAYVAITKIIDHYKAEKAKPKADDSTQAG
jgi:uncharacterized membrane protein (DUF441 family)